MKQKIILILVISRVLDLSSTYLAGNGHLYGETSPLVRIFKFGWQELLTFNFVLIFLIYFTMSFSYEKVIQAKEIRYKNDFTNFKIYLSLIFFDKKISFKELLLSSKINFKIYIHTLILSFPICLIVISVLVSINNLIVMKDNTFLSEFLPRNLTNIIALFSFITLLLIQLFYLKIRFKNINEECLKKTI